MHQRRQNRNNGNNVVSNCGDVVIHGSIDHVITKHEALGYQALRAEDSFTAHTHFQHADHFKRVRKGE